MVFENWIKRGSVRRLVISYHSIKFSSRPGKRLKMTPFDDFFFLVNQVLLGNHPTIEDFILLIGTMVAFIAFILWCCFPIHPKEGAGHHNAMACKSHNATKSNYHANGAGDSYHHYCS